MRPLRSLKQDGHTGGSGQRRLPSQGLRFEKATPITGQKPHETGLPEAARLRRGAAASSQGTDSLGGPDLGGGGGEVKSGSRSGEVLRVGSAGVWGKAGAGRGRLTPGFLAAR